MKDFNYTGVYKNKSLSQIIHVQMAGFSLFYLRVPLLQFFENFTTLG